MTYQEFTGSEQARRRYWARSFLGWHTIGGAEPNEGHHAVAALAERGLVTGVITQNVDGLHAAAGTAGTVELHGNLARVRCLQCGEVTGRPELQARLEAANPAWTAEVSAHYADGDVEVEDGALVGFAVPVCLGCGGTLKPDVVYFGEPVPADRVRAAFAVVDAARSLLVLGSSLTVMSGYRFVLHAVKRGLPVAIVNLGPTRGDRHADVRVDAPLGAALSAVNTRVRVGARPASGRTSVTPSRAAAMAVPSSP